jgi:hypothetical protein
MEASRKTKIHLKLKLGYTPTKGTLGIRFRCTIGRMPRDRTSRILDASPATPNRSDRFSKTSQAGFGLTATLGHQPRLCGSVE